MRKVLGVVATAFVFVLGLVGIVSAEEVPGRSADGRHKNQNLVTEKSRWKVQNLETKQLPTKGENLETLVGDTTDNTKAVDMFSKLEGNETIRR